MRTRDCAACSRSTETSVSIVHLVVPRSKRGAKHTHTHTTQSEDTGTDRIPPNSSLMITARMNIASQTHFVLLYPDNLNQIGSGGNTGQYVC